MRHTLYLLLLFFVISCNNRKDEKYVTIAAAANVQFPIREIIMTLEKQTNTEIRCVIASSGKLTSQIKEGAPFDIFISADTLYPGTLASQGMTNSRPRIYAEGILVLWSLESDLLLTGDLSVLLDKRVEKIALPNPDYAPYGRAAIESMKNCGIYETVQHKLVYGQNITQSSQYIISRSAQVGFTAKSMVLSEGMKQYDNWVEIDQELYTPILQSAVIIKRKVTPPEVDLIYNLLFSETCKDIFRRYGYRV
jgi:molybdate transport system substrate-binding protein